MTNEDEGMMWQEVLDEVAAGRTERLRCPFCRKADVKVAHGADRTRIECPACRRFIEGRMATS
jgi:hypothetical protein